MIGTAPARRDVPAPARPRPERAAVLINPAAGRASPGDGEAAVRILEDHGLKTRLHTVKPARLDQALAAALAGGPDLLVILAGDGTARAAASACGPAGPLVAPLPGGTMNILPYALYGRVGWRAALESALELGVETPVSGGRAGGRAFHVAAILGAAARFAEAREAARARRLGLAFRRARAAMRRAFASSLRFQLDGGPTGKALALALTCPLTSTAMEGGEAALEAAALNPHDAAEAARLGLRALLSRVAGDWRDDPAVETRRCRSARAWSGGRIAAILDGEPMRLGRTVRIEFVPVAFHALAPPRAPA